MSETIPFLFQGRREPELPIGETTYLSLQYRREVLGTVICLSHMALWDGVSLPFKTIAQPAR